MGAFQRRPLGDEGAHRAEPVAVGERAQDHPRPLPGEAGLAVGDPKRSPLRTGLACYVVGLRERLRSGAAATFRDWLVKEAQHLRELGVSKR